MSNYLAQRLIHHERITVHPRSELTSARGEDRLTPSRGEMGSGTQTSSWRPAGCS
jgi:hypothetical protein